MQVMEINYRTSKKENASASVKEYFGLSSNDKGEPANSDKPVCTICRKKIVAKGSNILICQLRKKWRSSSPPARGRK